MVFVLFFDCRLPQSSTCCVHPQDLKLHMQARQCRQMVMRSQAWNVLGRMLVYNCLLRDYLAPGTP